MVSWPMKVAVEVRKDDILVTARGRKEEGHEDYFGPYCRVWHDKDWLFVSTDDYEGTAMLNIEALPALRRALGVVAKQIKQNSTK